MFADTNNPYKDENDIQSAQNYNSDGCIEREEEKLFRNYVDTDWTRFYETSTDFIHTTIFGTTCNQLHAYLLRMASQIGPDMSGTHRKAIVIQVASNRDTGISAGQMLRGK